MFIVIARDGIAEFFGKKIVSKEDFHKVEVSKWLQREELYKIETSKRLQSQLEADKKELELKRAEVEKAEREVEKAAREVEREKQEVKREKQELKTFQAIVTKFFQQQGKLDYDVMQKAIDKANCEVAQMRPEKCNDQRLRPVSIGKNSVNAVYNDRLWNINSLFFSPEMEEQYKEAFDDRLSLRVV